MGIVPGYIASTVKKERKDSRWGLAKKTFWYILVTFFVLVDPTSSQTTAGEQVFTLPTPRLWVTFHIQITTFLIIKPVAIAKYHLK